MHDKSYNRYRTRCTYCRAYCDVLTAGWMPDWIIARYGAIGLLMATCSAGQRRDKDRYGACFADLPECKEKELLKPYRPPTKEPSS